MRNGKNIYDTINSARPNDRPLKVVLNQVGIPRRPEIPVKDFAEAMGAEGGPECPCPPPFLMLTPARHGTDGFYCATLRRTA